MLMLGLIITLAPTVDAKSYVSDDSTVINAQYHELFNNYFSGENSYLYFPYKCKINNYDRVCYFGIDSKGNYLNVGYIASGNSYVTSITSGVDSSFDVSGNNVVRKGVKGVEIIKIFLIFLGVFYIICQLI